MDPKLAHEFSSDHKLLIQKSTRCGCFYCKRIFKPSEIKEWIDKNNTALCPYCGVDSVLPNFSGMCDSEFLKQMYEKWFGTFTDQYGNVYHNDRVNQNFSLMFLNPWFGDMSNWTME